jgi:hypothetical protein
MGNSTFFLLEHSKGYLDIENNINKGLKDESMNWVQLAEDEVQ